MNKKVLSFVNKLEGYKTAIKELHWDADNMSQHQLCDDIADRIADFQDQVSEVEQSITGKLAVGNLKPTSYKVTNLKKFVEDVLDETNSFYKSLEDEGDTYTGMKSDCESFLSDMQRNLYLVNFTMKEDLKRRIAMKINESMPKNPMNVDDGMSVDGYIKCMAAGSMQDPFDAYDTCMVLWPKSNRILEGINEYGDSKETREKMGMAAKRDVMRGSSKTYQNAINSLGKRGSSKEDYGDLQRGFENESKQFKLTEGELKQVIKEAAMKLIKEMIPAITVGDREKRLQNQLSWHSQKPNFDDPNKLGDLVDKGIAYQRQARDLHRENPELWKHMTTEESIEEGDSDSGIHIKKSKEGTFTAAANKHGKSVQGFASQVLKNKGNYSPAMVKKANFARNAKKWKK